MTIKPEQVLSKTLKGIDAARSGTGISSKVQSVLKLVDGAKTVSELMVAAKSSGVAEADFQAALAELNGLALVRVVERASTAAAQGSAAADVENQLLLTLDFTKQAHDHQQKAATTNSARVAMGRRC